MKLSYSGQHSGWQTYPATTWDERKPLDWLDDWPFWEWCAREFGNEGPILDLACGNGRITRSLVMAGWTVVAVDMNPHFLNRAVEAVPSEQRSRVDFYLQDVVMLDIDHPARGQFPLALMADWAFPALLTLEDQRSFLNRLAEHLAPEGMLAFNTPFATSRQHGLEPLPDGSGLHWPGENRTFDPLTQIETRMSATHPIKLRHHTLDSIQLLAELTGFTVHSVFGGTDKRPVRGLPGDDLTLILQKR